MKTSIGCALAVMISLSCEQAAVVTIGTITSNWDSHRDGEVRIGVRVSRSSDVISLSSRLLDYITIEDESGRIDVWYNTVQRRCPPRLGATVTADGEVADIETTNPVAGETQTRPAFVAGSFAIDDEPPLADNEVRLCQLSLQEQQALAMEGPEGSRSFGR